MIKEVMEFDPLAQAEKIFDNKHWSEFSDDEMKASMGLTLLFNERKNEILQKSHDTQHDTHFSMDWDEFEEIVTSNGFRMGYEEKFPYEDHYEKAVMFYREDGLLIWVTSFWNMKSVNGGTLYGEIKLNDISNRSRIPSCSNGFFDFENNKLHFDTDVREGLIWFINQMKQHGEFIPQWEENNKFLWFLNFGYDEKNNSDSYKEISKNKMIKFCDEAKRIVQKYLD